MEKRRHKRWLLTKPLKIYNKQSNIHIGNLIDITTGGLGMVSKYPLKPDSTVKFEIDLSDEKVKFDSIELKAKNVWCEEKLLNRYFAGLEFENINEDLVNKIKDVILHYGYTAHESHA